MESRHVERMQIQPITRALSERVFLAWSTSARFFLERPVARCQGFLDPWGVVEVQNSCRQAVYDGSEPS